MFKGSTHLCGSENVDLIKVQGAERSMVDDFVNVCGFHSGESVMGSPIPGKEHGENMDHFFSMFLEKHEKKIINYVFSYVYRNDLIMFLLRVCACSQHGKAPLMTKKGSFRHIFLQITLVKH